MPSANPSKTLNPNKFTTSQYTQAQGEKFIVEKAIKIKCIVIAFCFRIFWIKFVGRGHWRKYQIRSLNFIPSKYHLLWLLLETRYWVMNFQPDLVRPHFIFYMSLSFWWPDLISEGEKKAQLLLVCVLVGMLTTLLPWLVDVGTLGHM